MEKQNVDLLIQEADQLLERAFEEIQRSEEDVIAYMVCHNSRQSIVNYLASYLINNGESLKEPVTITTLMDQCRSLDGRFNLIDISQISCSHKADDEDYCTNVTKVTECLEIAKLTRGIAINDSPGY
jgi:hypothetical protein